MKRVVLVLGLILVAVEAGGVFAVNGEMSCSSPEFSCQPSQSYVDNNPGYEGKCYVWQKDSTNRYSRYAKFINTNRTDLYSCSAFGLQPIGDCSCQDTLSVEITDKPLFTAKQEYESAGPLSAWCLRSAGLEYSGRLRRESSGKYYYDHYKCSDSTICKNVLYYMSPQRPNVGEDVVIHIDRSYGNGSTWGNVGGLLDGSKTIGVGLCYGDGATNCSNGYNVKIPASQLTAGMHTFQLTTNNGSVQCNKATFMVFDGAGTSTPAPTSTPIVAAQDCSCVPWRSFPLKGNNWKSEYNKDINVCKRMYGEWSYMYVEDGAGNHFVNDYQCKNKGFRSLGDCSGTPDQVVRDFESAGLTQEQCVGDMGLSSFCEAQNYYRVSSGNKSKYENGKCTYEIYSAEAVDCSQVSYYLEPVKLTAGNSGVMQIDRADGTGSGWSNVKTLLDGNEIEVKACYGDGLTNCDKGYHSSIPSTLSPGTHTFQLTTDNGAKKCNKVTFEIYPAVPQSRSLAGGLVVQYYKEFLGQNISADAVDAKWHIDRMMSGGCADDAKVFIGSEAFSAKKINLSNAEYVKVLYRALLSRDPDGLSNGSKAWEATLSNGVHSRDTIVDALANSPEAKTVCMQGRLLGVATPTVAQKIKGDANGDRKVDILDFGEWRKEYLKTVNTKNTDFNNDGAVNIVDFGEWRKEYMSVVSK